ncbi:hypothetical protein JCM24511_06929 [Saitozyma sp. JCM 24511]|nr:hypothetical protein JCM24511_06929 [Saitozyma sp. JCM 24511]
MTNYIAVEEESTHYKTFLHWDDDDEPRVTIFTDMVDPEEGRPRLESMFSFIQVPCALITNWDRSVRIPRDLECLLIDRPRALEQLLAGVEEGYLRRMASQDSALPAARSELQMEVEESYREAIRSVKTFRETLQRTMDGVAYATREIDPNMNKVFWAAGIRSNELEVQLEHWERVQARILDQCGAYQARRVARSVASGNTVRLAMEDASASEIAQQTGLRVEDVAAALNQASDLARESDEDEDDTNRLNGYANGSNGNGHNGNGHNASDDHSAMDTEF